MTGGHVTDDLRFAAACAIGVARRFSSRGRQARSILRLPLLELGFDRDGGLIGRSGIDVIAIA